MKPMRITLSVVALLSSGCTELTAIWTQDHDDRFAAITARCRSYGHVSGSPALEDCVEEKSSPQNQAIQAEQDARIEAMKTSNTTYSKDASQKSSRSIWMGCTVLPDGQQSCEGR